MPLTTGQLCNPRTMPCPMAWPSLLSQPHPAGSLTPRGETGPRGQTFAGSRSSPPLTKSRSFSRVSGSVEYTIVPTMPRVSRTL